MGLDVFPRHDWFKWQAKPVEEVLRYPFRDGAIVGVKYALVFCVLPWLLRLNLHSWPGSSQLFILQIYGALWATWATVTTKLTISSALRTLTSGIIPNLSDATATDVKRRLDAFDRRKNLCVSLLIGAIAAIVGGILVSFDLRIGPSWDVVFWSIGWWILFTTSANVVITGQFYLAFSQSLSLEAANLFPLDPSRSSLVLSMAQLGRTMLYFWLGIALSIGLIFPFSAIEWTTLAPFSQPSWGPLKLGYFGYIEVLATGFFSIGLGTVIFLAHEIGIRRAISASLRITLQPIEVETIALLRMRIPLDEADQARLAMLLEQHGRIAQSGSYRSEIVSGFSLMIPLIPTIAKFLTDYFAKPH